MSKGSRAKVLYEYAPENDDELALEVGEIISDIKPAEDGWLEGTINGRHGVFPDNFVEMLPDVPDPAAVVVEKREKKRFARVTFSYAAESTDELSLEVGELVEVTGEEEDGWWIGTLNGKTGVFPNNFVEEVPEEEAAAPKKKAEEPPKPEEPKSKMGRNMSGAVKLPFMMPPGGGSSGPPPAVLEPAAPEAATEIPRDTPGKKVEKAKVIFDYEAGADDELSLTVGEVVEITSKDVTEGWWEGKLGGKTGVFPNNFVELLPEEAPPPRKPVMTNKVQVMPVKLADLKKAAEERKNVESKGEKEPPKRPEPKKVEPPKKPEELKPTRAKPPPAKQPPASGPKPAVKPPAPAPPGRKPPPGVRRPEPPKKMTEKKDEDDVKPEVEKEHPAPEPVKAQPPPKPADSGDKEEPGVAPWMKELRKRKNTGESAHTPPAVPPAKPEPVKPAPSPAPTPAPATVQAAAPPPVKPSAVHQKPAGTVPPPASVPTTASAADSGAGKPTEVSSAALVELKDELAEMKKKLAAVENNFKEEIERLEFEIDEEKKLRMTMQVEIDRLKRRKD